MSQTAPERLRSAVQGTFLACLQRLPGRAVAASEKVQKGHSMPAPPLRLGRRGATRAHPRNAGRGPLAHHRPVPTPTTSPPGAPTSTPNPRPVATSLGKSFLLGPAARGQELRRTPIWTLASSASRARTYSSLGSTTAGVRSPTSSSAARAPRQHEPRDRGDVGTGVVQLLATRRRERHAGGGFTFGHARETRICNAANLVRAWHELDLRPMAFRTLRSRAAR